MTMVAAVAGAPCVHTFVLAWCLVRGGCGGQPLEVHRVVPNCPAPGERFRAQVKLLARQTQIINTPGLRGMAWREVVDASVFSRSSRASKLERFFAQQTDQGVRFIAGRCSLRPSLGPIAGTAALRKSSVNMQ